MLGVLRLDITVGRPHEDTRPWDVSLTGRPDPALITTLAANCSGDAPNLSEPPRRSRRISPNIELRFSKAWSSSVQRRCGQRDATTADRCDQNLMFGGMKMSTSPSLTLVGNIVSGWSVTSRATPVLRSNRAP